MSFKLIKVSFSEQKKSQTKAHPWETCNLVNLGSNITRWILVSRKEDLLQGNMKNRESISLQVFLLVSTAQGLPQLVHELVFLIKKWTRTIYMKRLTQFVVINIYIFIADWDWLEIINLVLTITDKWHFPPRKLALYS